MYTKEIALGCDIGGTHIACVLIDIKARKQLAGTLVRKHVDAGGEAYAIIQSWASGMRASMEGQPLPLFVGIAMPGPFDYDKGISYITGQDKYEKLYGLHVKELLAEELGMPASHIHFNNDAACYLQGEIFAGAGKGYDHVVGLTLGTGLGSSSSRNGVVKDEDLWRAPFKEGIAEDYLSSRWFTAAYNNRVGETVSGVKDLVERYEDDAAVSAIFDDFGHHLGEFVASYFGSRRPDLLVLGGNIAKASDYFLPSVYHSLEQSGVDMEIKKATLGELSAMFGAVDLAAR